MDADDTISNTLLHRLKTGVPGAWERLVQLYTPLLYYWVRGSGVATNDEDDLVQDVLLSVARSIERFDRERGSGSFRGWMRVIARNRIADHFDTRRRHGGPIGGTAELEREPPAGPPDGPDDDEIACLYQQALRMIAPEFEARTMDVFRRLMIDDLAPLAVAGELGMSVGAVYQAKHRVMSRLERELAEMI